MQTVLPVNIHELTGQSTTCCLPSTESSVHHDRSPRRAHHHGTTDTGSPPRIIPRFLSGDFSLLPVSSHPGAGPVCSSFSCLFAVFWGPFLRAMCVCLPSWAFLFGFCITFRYAILYTVVWHPVNMYLCTCNGNFRDPQTGTYSHDFLLVYVFKYQRVSVKVGYHATSEYNEKEPDCTVRAQRSQWMAPPAIRFTFSLK